MDCEFDEVVCARKLSAGVARAVMCGGGMLCTCGEVVGERAFARGEAYALASAHFWGRGTEKAVGGLCVRWAHVGEDAEGCDRIARFGWFCGGILNYAL